MSLPVVRECLFVQAEDGIRDIGVTGVQTCALPVSGAVIAVGVLAPFGAFDTAVDEASRGVFGTGTGLVLTGSVAGLIFAYRSEERRAGKECRSSWAPPP